MRLPSARYDIGSMISASLFFTLPTRVLTV